MSPHTINLPAADPSPGMPLASSSYPGDPGVAAGHRPEVQSRPESFVARWGRGPSG